MVSNAVLRSRETSYFGNNLFPKTDAEVLADGLVVVMAGIALMLRQLEKNAN